MKYIDYGNTKIKKKGMIYMKFIKGAMIGGIVATSIYMMYSENFEDVRRKMAKKGKKFIKKLGVI